jgi:hypothetical protein
MNCLNHTEAPAVAYCRACGKALCQECQRTAQGTIFCAEHVPAASASPAAPAADSPWTVPPTASRSAAADPGASPGLAFILGLIPGVGAIYNGQYAKGLLHVVVLGLLISITSSGAAGGMEPLFGLLIPLWFFYMAFEAYHTAQKRQIGEAVDEFSSILPLRGGGFPVAPVLLIGFGVLFLLNNLEIISFYHVLRYWPVFLIALGIWLLYERMSESEHLPVSPETPVSPEANDEHQ